MENEKDSTEKRIGIPAGESSEKLQQIGIPAGESSEKLQQMGYEVYHIYRNSKGNKVHDLKLN